VSSTEVRAWMSHVNLVLAKYKLDVQYAWLRTTTKIIGYIPCARQRPGKLVSRKCQVSLHAEEVVVVVVLCVGGGGMEKKAISCQYKEATNGSQKWPLPTFHFDANYTGWYIISKRLLPLHVAKRPWQNKVLMLLWKRGTLAKLWHIRT